MRKYLSDGTGLMSTFGRGKQEVQLECTFEGNAATIAERAQWLTSVPRVVRLTSTGSVIPGSSPSQAKIADIIVCGRWDAFVIGEKGTNTTFTAVLKGFVDPVLNYDIKATVTNGLVTLP